jgi:hypothetical protein
MYLERLQGFPNPLRQRLLPELIRSRARSRLGVGALESVHQRQRCLD